MLYEVITAASFKARGQAGMDRLERDPMQQACSQPAGSEPSADVVKAISSYNFV